MKGDKGSANRKSSSKKNITKKRKTRQKLFYMSFIVIVLALTIILSLSIVIKFQKPIGTDFALQLKFAEEYAQGKNALFGDTAKTSLAGPYPPLFQLILALMIHLGIVKQFSLIMQFAVYPAVFVTTAWLLIKKKDLVFTAFTFALMFSSRALFDRAQVIPQALDMILFPLILYFFIEEKKFWFVLLMAILIYSHGAYSLLLLGSIILLYLWQKKKAGEQRRKMVVYTIFIALPIIFLTAAFFPQLVSFQAQPDVTTNKQVILENPHYIISLLGWPIFIAFLASAFYWIKNRKQLDLLDKGIITWMICLIPILIFLPDRFPSYATVPMALFGAKTLAGLSSWNKWAGITVLILIFIIGLFTNYLEAWLLYTGVTGYSFQFG